ncbi:MAG: ROK family glucokinase [Planctomycetes bacterium]|nr:ROK family glucokinase [Planctomycetota bacterium]MBI3834219.1 ROK family glucokinase [Planctomycetota bacterium]
MSNRAAIGIDLGGTNLKIAIVDERGKILAKRSQPTDAARGPQHVVDQSAQVVAALLPEVGITYSNIVSVGVGTPGPLDLKKGFILRAANLPNWIQVPLRDMLTARMNLPVVLDNDANAAAYGEWWTGAGKAGGDLVMLTLGTGVGGGAIINGKVLHGAYGNAAELGHMIVVADGLPCPCGQRGCLEQYSSASGIVRRVEAAIRGGEHSSLCVSAPVDSETVVKAAEQGDPLCERIFDEACRFLAIVCVNIQHAFNPATIVLGGGFSGAGEALLRRVRQHRDAETWKLCDDAPDLRISALGADAGVIGAAGLALDARASK